MTGPHPDDELLSAVLDGEAGPDAGAHVAGCLPCQARLEAMGAVSRAVGAPVPPRPAAEVAAAVSRAIAAGAGPTRLPEGEALPPAEAGQPGGEPALRRAGRRRNARIGAIAAVCLALGGIASLVGLAATHHARPVAVVSPSQAPQAASAPTGLGEQSDPAALAAVLRPLLGQSTPAGAAFAPAGPPPAALPGSCQAAAAAGAGLPTGTRPLLAASLSWRGQPAEVTVFEQPVAAGGRIAVVTAVAGCSILARVPV
jgi:hypothetical protein